MEFTILPLRKENTKLAQVRPSEDEIYNLYNEGKKNPGIRKLTPYEELVYSTTVSECSQLIADFLSPLFTVISPMVDTRIETAYITKHARVSLSPHFFYTMPSLVRRFVLIHEAMHVYLMHFARQHEYNIDPSTGNIVGDLEINTSLLLAEKTGQLSLSYSDPGFVPLVPEQFGFKNNLSMEQYYELMKESFPDGYPDSNESSESDGQDGSSSSSAQDSSQSQGGNGGKSESSVDGSGEETDNGGASGGGARESGTCSHAPYDADDLAEQAGIPSVTPQTIEDARSDSQGKMKELMDRSKSKGVGNSHLNQMYLNLMTALKPPKVNWRKVFSHVFGSYWSRPIAGNKFTSLSRPNRRLTTNSLIFPGTRSFSPTCMVGIDTSGSMGDQDFERFLGDVEEIVKTKARDGVSIFSVDTEVSNMKTVKSMSQISLKGGGGTRMTTAFEYIESLPVKTRPHVFVLCTDGELLQEDWEGILEHARSAQYKTVILCTQETSMKYVPSDLSMYATVICVDD